MAEAIRLGPKLRVSVTGLSPRPSVGKSAKKKANVVNDALTNVGEFSNCDTVSQ